MFGHCCSGDKNNSEPHNKQVQAQRFFKKSATKDSIFRKKLVCCTAYIVRHQNNNDRPDERRIEIIGKF